MIIKKKSILLKFICIILVLVMQVTFVNAKNLYKKDVFGLENIFFPLKYTFNNLETIYQCELYEEVLNNNTLSRYMASNKKLFDEISKKIVFFGDDLVKNIKTYDMTYNSYIVDTENADIVKQANIIDNYDFSNYDVLYIWNDENNNDKNTAEENINAYLKMIDILSNKYPNLTIRILSFVPTYKSMRLDKIGAYNIFLNEFISSNYLDITSLINDTAYNNINNSDGEKLNYIFYNRLMPFLFLNVELVKIKNMKKVDTCIVSNDINGGKLSDAIKDEKIIYMTFDDGPSNYTSGLLDILNQNQVKATFFVTANSKNNYPLITRIVTDGHTLGAHTYSHNYKIYKAEYSYFIDLYNIEKLIRNYTGAWSNIIRFPGGSSNTISRKYRKGIMTNLTTAVTNCGFYYYDWKVSSGDGNGNFSKDVVYANAVNSCTGKDRVIILFHDIKKSTVDMIQDFITWGKTNGYTFKGITYDIDAEHHVVNN